METRQEGQSGTVPEEAHLKTLHELVINGQGILSRLYTDLPDRIGCIDENDLAAFLDNELPARKYDSVVSHIAGCGYCLAVVKGYLEEKADGNI